MYVVKYNDHVALGIIPWNNKYIMDVMRTRYRENVELPYVEPSADQFPLVVKDNITIYQAEEAGLVSMNPLIQYYYGPSWNLVNNKMVASYEVRPLSIEDCKTNYKDKAALSRYQKEFAGTTITINGIAYTIETHRESRNKYINKFLSMSSDQTVNWKFSEGWCNLSKQQIGDIITAIEIYIQSIFDEEYQLNLIIDQAQNTSELLAIEALNINYTENQ